MANLRAVKPGETGRPAKKLTVAEAAATGDQRALLVAMRDRIAKAVSNPECPPRDLASLTKRLDDIADKIKALDLKVEDEAEHDATIDEAWDAEAL